MAALAGIHADVYVTSTPSVGFVDDTLTDSGDHTTYFESVAAHRYWDRLATFLVETSPDGTTWSTAAATTYTLQYVGGKVVFNVAETAGTHVRISGNYLPVSQAGQAHDWALDIDTAVLDSSAFGSTWKQFTAAQHGATATLDRFWLDTFFASALDNETTLVLVLYVDTTNGTGTRYEAFAHIDKDSPKSAVASLVEESVSFIVEGQVFYVAS